MDNLKSAEKIVDILKFLLKSAKKVKKLQGNYDALSKAHDACVKRCADLERKNRQLKKLASYSDYRTCPQCNGEGGFQVSRDEGAVCDKCGGKGVVKRKTPTL
jgi:DnaJ-class molecular chaperone